MITPSGGPMRRLTGLSSNLALCAMLGALALLFLPRCSAAQAGGQALHDALTSKDYASSGRIILQIQDAAGAPFFEGATIRLLTTQIATTVSTTSDQVGKAQFTALPVGQYVLEIAAPGYRTVQEQVLISGTQEEQNVIVALVPTGVGAKIKVGSVSASPNAIKESEKGLHALQVNRLAEAQQHLARALAFDPTFADGNYLMGLLLLRQKDFPKAAAYLQKTLSLSPDHAAAQLALGEAQYLDHDYSHAQISLEKFLHDQPNSAQAPVARKYVAAIGKLLEPKPAGDAATAAEGVGSSPSGLRASTSAATDSELPPLPDLTAETEANWAPPDVDSEKLDLDSAAPCHLDEVIKSASGRAQELIENVDRFTATEDIAHSTVSPLGLETSRETRKFEYLVEIRKVGATELDVREYRNTKKSVATQEFPGNIATLGLPTLALIFHPNLQARYEFRCEGRGSWQGHPAWVVHFQQRADHSSSMLTYHVGTRFVAVGLKGRAWIDVDTSQILAMESDIMHPAPEIRLVRDHQLIEYGPVSFRNRPLQLWLPKSADWYCSISGQRFHRRHSFSQFLLFSTDDKQKISVPVVPVTSEDPQ